MNLKFNPKNIGTKAVGEGAAMDKLPSGLDVLDEEEDRRDEEEIVGSPPKEEPPELIKSVKEEQLQEENVPKVDEKLVERIIEQDA